MFREWGSPRKQSIREHWLLEQAEIQMLIFTEQSPLSKGGGDGRRGRALEAVIFVKIGLGSRVIVQG